MEQDVESFIVALHRDIEAWLRGRGDEVTAARIEAAHDGDFRMSGTDGLVLGRDDVMSRIRSARGAAGDGFRIVIAHCEVVASEASLAVATYIEWQGQSEDGSTGGRRSVAVLRRAADGWKMLYLAEASLPAGATMSAPLLG